jgi:hypothetical protein
MADSEGHSDEIAEGAEFSDDGEEPSDGGEDSGTEQRPIVKRRLARNHRPGTGAGLHRSLGSRRRCVVTHVMVFRALRKLSFNAFLATMHHALTIRFEDVGVAVKEKFALADHA